MRWAIEGLVSFIGENFVTFIVERVCFPMFWCLRYLTKSVVLAAQFFGLIFLLSYLKSKLRQFCKKLCIRTCHTSLRELLKLQIVNCFRTVQPNWTSGFDWKPKILRKVRIFLDCRSCGHLSKFEKNRHD